MRREAREVFGMDDVRERSWRGARPIETLAWLSIEEWEDRLVIGLYWTDGEGNTIKQQVETSGANWVSRECTVVFFRSLAEHFGLKRKPEHEGGSRFVCYEADGYVPDGKDYLKATPAGDNTCPLWAA